MNVPTNSILTIHKQTVMVHPIIDSFYDRSPYHMRSSAFVQAKGLIANEKAASLVTPSVTPVPPSLELQKRMLGPSFSALGPSRSRTPEPAVAPTRARPPSGLHETSAAEAAAATSDMGATTNAPNDSSSRSRVPVRGNIKVKRKSLSPPEQAQAGGQTAPRESDDSSDSDQSEQQGSGIGHPHKLSRFFPELTMNQ